MTPLDRLLAAGVLSPAQQAELLTYRGSLTPATIGCEIADLQAVLFKLVRDKTEQLYLVSIPMALPHVRSGIRVKTRSPADPSFRGHLDLMHHAVRAPSAQF